MTPWLYTRYFAEYLLLRLIIGAVRLLPLDKAVAASASAWGFLAPLSRRRHERAMNNLAKAYPEKTEEERDLIARAMWKNLGRVMAETMQMDRLLSEPERIEIINSHILERYRNKLGAAVCVSLHTGNWELAMWPLAVNGAKPAAVYRLVKNPLVDQYLRGQRTEIYPGGLFARGRGVGINAGHETARMVGSYIRNGGRLGMLGDLFDRTGIPVPFFGHDAPSTPFPAMLARRIGTRLWIGRCIRIGDACRFKVEMMEVRVPRTDDFDADIKAITTAVQAQFESWIREYPEQFMWSNRRYS
ncbi:MAG: lysophospholipid acyltransferase family protein [Methyloligellaceae bacterium]